jgi:hypothetical protein
MSESLEKPARSQPASAVSDADVVEFNRRGYLAVPGALPAEKVAELLQAIDEIRDSLVVSPGTTGFRPMIDKHEAFLDLLEWPATFPKAVRFLQHYNIQVLTTQLVIVPPDPDRPTIGWHRDGGLPRPTAGGSNSRLSLKVGFFLTDLLEADSGELQFLPSSHLKDGRSEDAENEAVAIPLRAGDAVLFDNRVYHTNAPNRSRHERIALYFAYGYRWLEPIDYAGSMPDWLLDRCTPIGRQLLGEKSSQLGYHYPLKDDVPLKPWYRERFGKAWLA